MARNIESFLADVEQALDRDLGDGRVPKTKRKLSAVVRDCGWKRRSEQRLAELEFALARAGVFMDHDLSNTDLSLDTWIWFTREPPPIVGKVFRTERALGYHLGKYKEELERALPHLAPLTHYYGGNKTERTYALDSESLKPDLVFKSATGSWLVCEVEKGDPDLESVPQLSRYIQAVRNTGKHVTGALITAKPRTEPIRRHVALELSELEGRGESVAWIWYDLAISLDVVFGGDR